MSLSLGGAEPFSITPEPALAQAPIPQHSGALVYNNKQRAKSTATRSVASIHVEAEVRAYFNDIPIMTEIARCESKFNQTDSSGNVIRGMVNSRDVGVMQINEDYHAQAAQAMGLDLHVLKDNMAYARHLYEHEGTRPWLSSASCWRHQGESLASNN